MNLVEIVKNIDPSLKVFECKDPHIVKVVLNSSSPSIPKKLIRAFKENNFKISKRLKIIERQNDYKLVFSLLKKPSIQMKASMKENFKRFLDKLEIHGDL